MFNCTLSDNLEIGKACGKQKAIAPFKKLAKHQDHLFYREHLPSGFSFPNDPSYMWHEHACEFLQHIRSQQTCYDSELVFAFHKYLDADGEVQLALN